ncbi:hypothetical protein PMAC_001570 [Pneumocystis sp. 'macacae']|nr:hypothetical protein PMAC_001570 [Pneumocystis sp. 'macacae']
MGKKVPMNSLDSEKNSSYFDDDKNSIFSRMKNRHFLTFHANLSKIFFFSREIKQQEDKKEYKNKANQLIKKSDQQSKQNKRLFSQKTDAFSSHLHLCHPLQNTSSLFHVPFSLALKCAILSSPILFFMPTKTEYFSNQVSSLTQLNDSLLFSFERGVGMFVLIEGALLHYGLHDDDICKPKHVIKIQHNTSIRILNHIEGSRWILELISSVDVSNLCLNNENESTLHISTLKNMSCLDTLLKNDKQKEIILFSIATQKSLNEWVRLFQHEISQCKQRLLSNQDFENNVFSTDSSIPISFPTKVRKKEKPPIPMRPDFLMDQDIEFSEKQSLIECKIDQLNSHNHSNKHFSEKITKEAAHTPKMLNPKIDKTQEKNHSTLTFEKPSVLPLFTFPDVPDISDCPSLEMSNSEDSRVPSYASSASIPENCHKGNAFYQLNTRNTQKEVLTIIPQYPLLSQHIIRNNI